MKTKHTPGPWHYDAQDSEAQVFSQYGQIARVFGGERLPARDGDEEGAENSRLIAAAPDLLATLKAVIARMDGEFDNPELLAWGPLLASRDAQVYQHIAAAIVKAEGK